MIKNTVPIKPKIKIVGLKSFLPNKHIMNPKPIKMPPQRSLLLLKKAQIAFTERTGQPVYEYM